MSHCLFPTSQFNSYHYQNSHTWYLYLYLYLRLMGGVAGQLVMPKSCQCRSSLFLNMLTNDASTTSCSNLFHSLTIRKLKKFRLTVVWHWHPASCSIISIYLSLYRVGQKTDHVQKCMYRKAFNTSNVRLLIRIGVQETHQEMIANVNFLYHDIVQTLKIQ